MTNQRRTASAAAVMISVTGLLTSACFYWPDHSRGQSSSQADKTSSQGSSGRADRAFKVGDKVETYYAGGWYAGTVVEIGSGKYPYKVRYDDDAYGESWQSPDRIRPFGQKLSTGYSLNPQDTFGTWSVATATTRPAGSSTYRDYHLAAAGGTLTINADGTYEWAVASDRGIRGQWEREPNPNESHGPVILPEGLNGHRWWVCYSGKTETGADSIYLKSDIGTSWSGFKR